MGAENSALRPMTKREPERKAAPPRIVAQTSQYHDAKNTKYVDTRSESRSSMSSCSSESSQELSSSTSEENSEERKETKIMEKTEKSMKPVSNSNALKSLEGLTMEEKTRKSEEMLRQLWKRPHSSWEMITAVTSITTEKVKTDGQISEDVHREVDFDTERIIYDVPLEHCHLKVPRSRTSRSCPDPWRRHGAHVKICEIGGFMPENRNKNSKVTQVRKGSTPPPPPRSKPLQTVDDYLKIWKK